MDRMARGDGQGWNSAAARRERSDHARAIRARKARCLALPPPSEAELARMIADIPPRGGGVTRCPPVCVLPVQNGDGPRGRQGEAPGLLNGGPEPSP